MTKSEFQFVTFNTLLNLRQTDNKQFDSSQWNCFRFHLLKHITAKLQEEKATKYLVIVILKSYLLYSNRNSKREKKKNRSFNWRTVQNKIKVTTAIWLCLRWRRLDGRTYSMLKLVKLVFDLIELERRQSAVWGTRKNQ